VIPYGDTDALEKAITPHSAAFLVEPIQGEAGVRIPPSGFLTKCFDICKKYNILFMADEIQTGFGRTGRRFCCDWESVKPDMLILGKALGGGIYPVSAAAAKKEVMDVFSPGEHGSTFGGNPLASALGRISLKVLTEERLAERSLEQGQFLIESLKTVKSRFIKEIRGRGLFVGIELHKEAGGARRFCEALQKQGVLCKETHDDVIRFAPPLIITKDELEWALKRVEKVFSEIE
jgi:ornithine--oxo-acid transaminase